MVKVERSNGGRKDVYMSWRISLRIKTYGRVDFNDINITIRDYGFGSRENEPLQDFSI